MIRVTMSTPAVFVMDLDGGGDKPVPVAYVEGELFRNGTANIYMRARRALPIGHMEVRRLSYPQDVRIRKPFICAIVCEDEMNLDKQTYMIGPKDHEGADYVKHMIECNTPKELFGKQLPQGSGMFGAEKLMASEAIDPAKLSYAPDAAEDIIDQIDNPSVKNGKPVNPVTE